MADDPYDNRRYHNADTFSVQSTAGAIPVRNKKGEVTMQKVKVQRYISGKRPDFGGSGSKRAAISSDEESDDTDEEDFVNERRRRVQHEEEDDDRQASMDMPPPLEVPSTSLANNDLEDVNDPRMRRLMAARQQKQQTATTTERRRRRRGSSDSDSDDGDRGGGQRRIQEPEVLSDGEGEGGDKRTQEDMDTSSTDSSGSDDDADLDDDMDEEAIQRRRDLMRQRALAKAQIGLGPEEVMEKEEEKEGAGKDSDDEETSEEETTDSEDEEEGAMLKPVFVRKGDRLTVQEREKEEAKEREAERQANLLAEQRKRDSQRLVETLVKSDHVERKTKDTDPTGMNEVNTDDENEEIDYEAWKLRELKRLKRDREEREARERELAEMEAVRNMTEEERRAAAKANPKVVTNKAMKGKYKFMQKYYHRGVFYLDEEDQLYKRDYSAATLEDKFDKTVLPKVMQVKNFGRSGRTKYTHLVDQDTTQFDSAWTQETTQSAKFQLQHGGGMKQTFTKPSAKRKKES